MKLAPLTERQHFVDTLAGILYSDYNLSCMSNKAIGPVLHFIYVENFKWHAENIVYKHYEENVIKL